MRSIKEQRERLAQMNSVDRINSVDAHALGYEILTKDYPELLDWAERAREYIKNMVPVLGGDGLGIVDRLLAELPEE